MKIKGNQVGDCIPPQTPRNHGVVEKNACGHPFLFSSAQVNTYEARDIFSLLRFLQVTPRRKENT